MYSLTFRWKRDLSRVYISEASGFNGSSKFNRSCVGHIIIH
jgi:hypothetical protein